MYKPLRNKPRRIRMYNKCATAWTKIYPDGSADKWLEYYHNRVLARLEGVQEVDKPTSEDNTRGEGPERPGAIFLSPSSSPEKRAARREPEKEVSRKEPEEEIQRVEPEKEAPRIERAKETSGSQPEKETPEKEPEPPAVAGMNGAQRRMSPAVVIHARLNGRARVEDSPLFVLEDTPGTEESDSDDTRPVAMAHELFAVQFENSVKEEHLGVDNAGVSKILLERYEALPPQQKAVYEYMETRDRERWEKETATHRIVSFAQVQI